MSKLSDLDVPRLEDWVNLTEAADILGVTRSYVYKLAGSNQFKTLSRIGTQSSYVVRREEVETRLQATVPLVKSVDDPGTHVEDQPIAEPEPDEVITETQPEEIIAPDEDSPEPDDIDIEALIAQL